MKRLLLVFIYLIFISFISGCILSKSPNTDNVTMNLGEQKTFSLSVFPPTISYAWTLDGLSVSTSKKLYNYTAQAGKHTLIVKAKHILGRDTQTWSIVTNNPVDTLIANAGADQSVIINTIVTLDGSGSFITNNIVSYFWQQTGGPEVTLSDPNAIQPKFTANVPIDSVLSFELTVTNSHGLTSKDSCKISAGDYSLFNRFYGENDCDQFNAVQQTSDGGYIMAGFAGTDPGVWLLKTDINGGESWSKTFFEGEGGGEIYAIIQTRDSGYILAGYTCLEVGICPALMIKTDHNGIKVWDKLFNQEGAGYIYAVQQTNDNGYILAGCYTSVQGSGNYDGCLIKTDENGNEQWNKIFGGVNYDELRSVQQTSDGGYILAGYTASFGVGTYNGWLIKTDTDGNIIWDKTFGGVSEENFYACQLTNDGGYIITGVSSSGPPPVKAWLFKTDSNGNKIWDKLFNVGDFDSGSSASAVQQTNDGGYILTGWSMNWGEWNDIAWLIKTDSDGNEMWERTFGRGFGYAVKQTSDGGYILAGYYIFERSDNFSDAWLIKTDAYGNAPAMPTP
jgi:hypothetical protein